MEVSKKKKIVISSSAKFQNKINEWKEYFESKNYEVINYPHKIDQKDIIQYKKVYEEFYKSLVETDILFVLDEDKNGINGYIGSAVFAEINYILSQIILKNSSQKIYLLKEPSSANSCYQEVKNFIDLGLIEIFDKSKI